MPPASQTRWKGLVQDLDRLGILTVVDGTALEAAVRAGAQARRADTEIERLQLPTAAGNTEESEYYRLRIQSAVSRKAWQQWKTFAVEFGLTPASRSRLAGLGIAPERGQESWTSSTETFAPWEWTIGNRVDIRTFMAENGFVPRDRLRRAYVHAAGDDATAIARRAVLSTPVVAVTARPALQCTRRGRSESFHQSFVRRLS